MEVTPEQRSHLLQINRTADHMFPYVYELLQQESVTVKQYNVLIKIHDMDPAEQKGYIIHKDTLYPVPTKLRKYQKTATGWKMMNRYTAGPGQRPIKYKKHKTDK